MPEVKALPPVATRLLPAGEARAARPRKAQAKRTSTRSVVCQDCGGTFEAQKFGPRPKRHPRGCPAKSAPVHRIDPLQGAVVSEPDDAERRLRRREEGAIAQQSQLLRKYQAQTRRRA